jgi:hypothetical protein
MISLDKVWLSHVTVTDMSLSYTIFPNQIMWELKNALVETGWSVFRSCDGTSVSASDLWTNRTKVVFSDTTHSWIVLTNSTFMPGFACCLDCNYINSYITFEACALGYNSDGTTIARPTTIGTAMTWASSYFFPNVNYVLSNVIKILYTSDMQNYRIIFTNGGECGKDSPNFPSPSYRGQAFFFEKPKSAASWWSTPFIVGRFDHTYGLTYNNLITSGISTMKTTISGSVVNILLGTIGVSNWPTRSGTYTFGNAYGNSMIMPPMYYISDSASYPGVMGIMYDAYPANPYHPAGTRYKTQTNSRGLLKAGPLAIGCPYGPMVV